MGDSIFRHDITLNDFYDQIRIQDLFRLNTLRQSQVNICTKEQATEWYKKLVEIIFSVYAQMSDDESLRHTAIMIHHVVDHDLIWPEIDEYIHSHGLHSTNIPRIIEMLSWYRTYNPINGSQIFYYNHFFVFIELALQIFYDQRESQRLSAFTILHVIFMGIQRFQMQFNKELAQTILVRHWTREKPEITALIIQIIDSLYTALMRNRAQSMDLERSKDDSDSIWHFEEYRSAFFNTNHDDTLQEADMIYYRVVMQRLFAYIQEYDNPHKLATVIHSHSIVMTPKNLIQFPEVADNKILLDAMNYLTRIMQGKHGYDNTNLLAASFVNHTVWFCNEIPLKNNHYQEIFIMKRAMELIINNPHLNVETFINTVSSKINEMNGEIYVNSPEKYRTFKTNLLQSLTNGITQLIHEIKGQPSKNEPTQTFSPTIRPTTPIKRWEDAVYSDDDIEEMDQGDDDADRDDAHGDGHTYNESDIPDFIKKPDVPHAVNRFDGPDMSNSNPTIEQKPYFHVKERPDDEERLDRELVNAAKRNAQIEYYRQMTENGVKVATYNTIDPSMKISGAFVTAEEKLAEIRGKIMQKYITSPSLTNDHDLVAIETGNYEDYVIELGIYQHEDEQKIISILNEPIKKCIARQTSDIFEKFENVSSLAIIIQLIETANFSTELASQIQTMKNPHKTLKNLDIDLTEILSSIRTLLRKKDHRRNVESDSKTMTLGSNYKQSDTTARDAVKELENTIFTYKNQPASFQISRNIPRFTHRELFQSEYTLKKSNLDFNKHLQKCFMNFIDVKVRLVTGNGDKIELTWTIHKHTKDHFHLMHMAYRSVDPTQTLLTPPLSLSQVTLQKNDYLPETIGKSQHKIRDENIYKADEITLMKLHAHGAKKCTETKISDILVTTESKSFGFIYMYEFWTLIGTCFQIGPASRRDYLTCYTIIHRNSDYAQKRAVKRSRDNGEGGGANVWEYAQAPRVVYVNTPPVQIVRHRRNIPRGDNWFIFGIVDGSNTDMYYFIQAPSTEIRILLDQKTRIFQSKVYKVFYPNTIMSSMHAGDTLTSYISNQLILELETDIIEPVPGMFALWMTKHPRGERPDSTAPIDGRFHSAQQYWTFLWDEFLKQQQIHVFKSNLIKRDKDQRLEDFKALYKRKEESQPAQGGDRGGGGYRGGGGGGYRGRGRGRGRGGGMRSQYSRHYEFNPDDTQHMYSLSEEAPQISEMQYEIDSLRRSLNQLALLQS